MHIKLRLLHVLTVVLAWIAFASTSCLSVALWTDVPLRTDDFFVALRFTSPAALIFAVILLLHRHRRRSAAPKRR